MMKNPAPGPCPSAWLWGDRWFFNPIILGSKFWDKMPVVWKGGTPGRRSEDAVVKGPTGVWNSTQNWGVRADEGGGGLETPRAPPSEFVVGPPALGGALRDLVGAVAATPTDGT